MAEDLYKWQRLLYRLWNAEAGEKATGRKIQRGKGRRLVIADIHGCYQTFACLLEQVALTPADQLFILGDMVNRGPYSALVLDRILELLKSGFQVFPLRGNHEQMLLKSTEKDLSDLAHTYHSMQLLKKGGLRDKYRSFFEMLPYYYELDCAFLVHAGFAFHKEQPLEKKKSMLWIREFDYRPEVVGNKLVLHGHQPHSLRDIRRQIEKSGPVIPLDNGCVMGNRQKGFGNLLALDLDSRQLYVQPNRDLVLKSRI